MNFVVAAVELVFANILVVVFDMHSVVLVLSSSVADSIVVVVETLDVLVVDTYYFVVVVEFVFDQQMMMKMVVEVENHLVDHHVVDIVQAFLAYHMVRYSYADNMALVVVPSDLTCSLVVVLMVQVDVEM